MPQSITPGSAFIDLGAATPALVTVTNIAPAASAVAFAAETPDVAVGVTTTISPPADAVVIGALTPTVVKGVTTTISPSVGVVKFTALFPGIMPISPDPARVVMDVPYFAGQPPAPISPVIMIRPANETAPDPFVITIG